MITYKYPTELDYPFDISRANLDYIGCSNFSVIESNEDVNYNWIHQITSSIEKNIAENLLLNCNFDEYFSQIIDELKQMIFKLCEEYAKRIIQKQRDVLMALNNSTKNVKHILPPCVAKENIGIKITNELEQQNGRELKKEKEIEISREASRNRQSNDKDADAYTIQDETHDPYIDRSMNFEKEGRIVEMSIQKPKKINAEMDIFAKVNKFMDSIGKFPEEKGKELMKTSSKKLANEFRKSNQISSNQPKRIELNKVESKKSLRKGYSTYDYESFRFGERSSWTEIALDEEDGITDFHTRHLDKIKLVSRTSVTA